MGLFSRKEKVGVDDMAKDMMRMGLESVGKMKSFDDLDAEYFLIKELQNGFLENISGTYKDPDGYFVDEEEVEIPEIKLKYNW